MMEEITFHLPYGETALEVRVPGHRVLAEVTPRPLKEAIDEGAEVRDALEAPTGTPRLRALARPGQRVAVVTSDLTRPCPSERLLPFILEELAAAGVADEDVTVVMALGLHRPMTEEELALAVGREVYERARVINHDPDETVALGETRVGTPVALFRPVVEADVRVCLGNLELHYFAGYSGGAKAIFPGCASEAGVRANHAMMVRPEAAAGKLEGNPVRADLEDAVGMVGADFILNVVVDSEHRIVNAVAGEVTVAHRRGCEMVARRGKVAIPERADVVVVSAGGYPKDVNLYQAQKALDNAAHAVRDGGVIVLVAECREGFGNETFREWMVVCRTPEARLSRLEKDFVLGGHKAAAIAGVQKRADVYLVSVMREEEVGGCGLMLFDDVNEAVTTALEEVGGDGQVIVMPEGGSVLPNAGS
ncbi:MAG: nickel-dependent lactate racemase [Chloroflexota bacterium]